MASENPQGTTPPSPESKYEVLGKEYTRAELEEAIRGGMKTADYTRKTQELAEQRREFEEWAEEQRAALEAERAAAPRTSADEDDPWVQRFSRLESMVETVHKSLAQRQADEAEEAKIKAQMNSIEQAIGAISNYPGFDRAQILQTMHAYGMNTPEQVEAAYKIIAGPKIERALAEREAAARGATAPGVMGSNGIAMTPPFSSAQEAAPSFDPGKLSWQELAKMAMEDPSRPR